MNDASTGQLISERYRLNRPLSTGGMGQVFEAVDTHLFNRRVAIKLLHQSLTGNEMLLRRFQTEARVSSLLGEHPLIVRVTDYGLYNDQPFIVMEFLGAPPIPGQPLNEMLQSGAMDVKRVVRLGRQMCAALQYAHSFEAEQPDFTIRGVIHRDIKPGNIFVLRDQTLGETIKLLDFGIAKTIADVTMALGTQMGFIGTPTYASPEQLRGEPLDFRSDVYSLGVVLYEMLAGELPLVPKTESFPAWYEAHNFQQPRTLNQSHIPPTLAEVIMSCLQKEPDRRPSSMEMLRDQLKDALQGSLARPSRTQAQAPAPAAEPDPEFQRLVRPFEVALADLNVATQFRLRGTDLHILLEYHPSRQLSRTMVVKLIASRWSVTKSKLKINQIVIYGRPFRHPRPQWQETLQLADLDEFMREADTGPVDTFDFLPNRPGAVQTSPPPDNDPDLDFPIPFSVPDLSPASAYPPEPSSSVDSDGSTIGKLSTDAEKILADMGSVPLPPSLIVPSPTEASKTMTGREAPPTYVTPSTAAQPSGSQVPDLATQGAEFETLAPGAQATPSQAGTSPETVAKADPAIAQRSEASEVSQDAELDHVDNAEIEAESQPYAKSDLDRATSTVDLLDKATHSITTGQHLTQFSRLQRRAFLAVLPNLAERITQVRDWSLQPDHFLDRVMAGIEMKRSVIDLDPSVMMSYHEGLDHLYEGDVEKAADAFQSALTQDPSLAEAQTYWGYALLKQGKLPEAQNTLQGAIRKDPQLAEARTCLGHIFLQQNQLDPAMSEFQAALEIKPDLVENYTYLLKIAVQRGYLGDTIQQYLNALERVPQLLSIRQQLADIMLLHGSFLLQNGQIEDAIYYLRKAVSLNSDDGVIHCYLGMTLISSRKKTDWQDAVTEFRITNRLNPGLAEGHIGLGIALSRLDNLKSAVNAYQLALNIDPDRVAAHYNLGMTLFRKGDLHQSIQQYQTVLELEPNFPEGHISLGLAQIQAGDLSGAIKSFKAAQVQESANLAEAHCGMGYALLATGELTEAIKTFRRALDVYPMLGAAQAGIGLTYLIQNQKLSNADPSTAKGKFELALRSDPNTAEAFYGLGELELVRDSLALAAKNFEAALHINRSYVAAHYKLAVVLAKQGRANEAISELRLALELNPNYPGAQTMLDQLVAKRWDRSGSSSAASQRSS